MIDIATSTQLGVLATDFFGFDNSANAYGLQGHGALSEMGAVLAPTPRTSASSATPLTPNRLRPD